MKNIKKLILVTSLFIGSLAFAQVPGDISQTFGKFPGFNNTVYDIATQPDGKHIIGGTFTSYNGTTENRIIRLNADGSKDTTFNTGTGIGFSSTEITSIAIQPDGKILIGGFFNNYNNVAEKHIMRLNSDGTKDTTFNTGTGFNAGVSKIVVQPDGKIIVGGLFITYNDVSANRIIRLNSDGTRDTSFSSGSGFDSGVSALVLQSDGKIIVGGSFTTYNGVTESYITRLNAFGLKDSAFSAGTGFNSAVTSLALQTDGKILVGGSFNSFNGTSSGRIARLNATGSIDSSFNSVPGFSSTPWTIALKSDGKILVGGDFTSYKGITENRIISLNTDGSKDTSTNFDTGLNGGSCRMIKIETDGKILVGGTFTEFNGSPRNRLIKLNNNGTLDTAFNTGTGFNATVFTIKTLSNGSYVVGGSFTAFNNSYQRYIAKFNSNGTLDSSFSSGTGFNSNVNTLAIQPDGKILAGGIFTTYNGTTYNRIIRLNTDGTADTTFTIGTGINSTVNTIIIQPDGKILVGGQFSTYNGTTCNRIVRLNTDGTPDTTFAIGTGFNSNVNTLAIQPDGKILVGGIFTTYNGTTYNRIIRLNTDGTPDTSFTIGTGLDSNANTIAIQPDGKILVGGSYTTYNGTSYNRIIRLNTDGTPDTTFSTGTGLNNLVNSINIQANGKIFLGGQFTSYNGTTENYIILLNADGTKDSTFNAGTGFNSTVNSMVTLINGDILVGGNFISYNNQNNSAYLISLKTESTLVSESYSNTDSWVVYPNPIQEILNIKTNDFSEIESVKIYDLNGKLVIEDNKETINVSKLSMGIYIAKITNQENQTKTFKLIKKEN